MLKVEYLELSTRFRAQVKQLELFHSTTHLDGPYCMQWPLAWHGMQFLRLTMLTKDHANYKSAFDYKLTRVKIENTFQLYINQSLLPITISLLYIN